MPEIFITWYRGAFNENTEIMKEALIYQHWWPLATTQQLSTGKILAHKLHKIPIVLFHNKDKKPVALLDKCPHRFAPLSLGKIKHGEIQCPYHGWRFDEKGHCTHVPGTAQKCTKNALIEAIHICENHGLIWAKLSHRNIVIPPAIATTTENPVDVFFMSDRIHCTLEDAAENSLDGFHTHFVHEE